MWKNGEKIIKNCVKTANIQIVNIKLDFTVGKIGVFVQTVEKKH